MSKPTSTRCPCGAAASYAECCGRWHAGAPAPTAEALMRSRYSAFALRDGTYLLATWHPDTRPATLDLAADDTRWLGLQIVASAQPAADLAYVEFVARSRRGGGPAQRLHERSRFVREGDRWFYCDGEFQSR